ncbi:hypothetical protein DERP_012939 [Dermatophagoides pteronyssinus]|uniref:Uncharacterized protein n=1 Tax=Dermatophagoides pteronyssinus TaxID=6956 RepID=A0ABQ8J3Q3_DERPT|nr:hypothetical protein DERP_012939 [Dermatophagoides pteronyssinus]
MQKILPIFLVIFAIVINVECRPPQLLLRPQQQQQQDQQQQHQNLEKWRQNLRQTAEKLIQDAQIENEHLKSQNREYLNGGLLKIITILKQLDYELSKLSITNDQKQQQNIRTILKILEKKLMCCKTKIRN